MNKKDCNLRSYLNLEVNIVDLQMYECMVCCYVVQVSDESFSVFCNQKNSVNICYIEEKVAFQCFWRKCIGKHAISLTELHAGHFLERQVW